MKGLGEWIDDSRRLWALGGLITGGYVLVQAALLNRWTIAGWPRPSLAMAAAGIVMGVGLLSGQRWARWIGILWLSLAILVQVINAASLGWTGGRLLSILFVVAGIGFYYWQVFREDNSEQANGEGDEHEPFLSLVLLFREAPYLDATVLRSLAQRAWGIEFGVGDDDGGEKGEQTAFLVGEPPVFMAKLPQAFVLIHHWEQPYFDNPEEVAESVVEFRARQAVLNHRAWTSVDVLHWFGEGDQLTESYRLIARLLAELADDNVLAVLDVEPGQIFCYDPELERKLRSDNPAAQLRERYYAPIVSISSDHPAMVEAVAEARRRWPEFVQAFEARTTEDDKPFLVKGPFGEEGSTEFMWVAVTGIENDVIYGTLENSPANVASLREGDRVTVRLEDLNDWLCVIDDNPVGAFTMKALADRAQGSRDEASDMSEGDS